MNELKEWPLSLAVATACFIGAAVTFPIAIGYMFGPPFGWLAITLELLFFAKQNIDIYQEEREQAKGKRT